jgi:UDP-glucose 4-epimerase
MKKNKETVFINGGAGLIGSMVARKLLPMGYKVVIFDSFITYISPFKTYIKNYIDLRFEGIKDDVIFERGDTTNISHSRKIINKYKPEYVLHLAAMPLADLSNEHVEEAVASILLGPINMLEILKYQNNLKNFVFVSSSMIYGDFKEVPCPETHSKTPKDIYGGSKYAGEIMIKTLSERFNLPHTIVRPSAVYGPYDINRRVSQIFVEMALMGKELRLDGGGKINLDFTYVEDIADGLILALFSNKALGEDFNITYGQGYSLLEFVETLKFLIPSLKYRVVESKDDFRPMRGALSIEKAKRILGYEPKYSLEKGLGKYVETYQKLDIFNKEKS